MELIKYLKNKIERKNKFILDTNKNMYLKLIQGKPISNIINSIPQDLSELEKAYYIYIELGKIVNENPQFVFTEIEEKHKYYNHKINNKYLGICKSISELYVSILKDKRIGIQADSVKENKESSISHVDTVIKIDGKNYVTNLISDLSRIKTSRRIKSFGFDIDKTEMKQEYLKQLEEHYGKIDVLSRNEIEKLDKKVKYSFYSPKFCNKESRGIYTDDTIELLAKDMNDSELFKQYILKGEDVPSDKVLKYKLDYIFNNINTVTHYNGKSGYLENIRYYLKIAEKILTPEESKRIRAYVARDENNKSDIVSILKVKKNNKYNGHNNNYYYLYSKENNTYIEKYSSEMKEIIDNYDKLSFNIVGMYDKYDPRDIDELEL